MHRPLRLRGELAEYHHNCHGGSDSPPLPTCPFAVKTASIALDAPVKPGAVSGLQRALTAK